MNRQAVVSSNVISVGYDEVSAVLEVEFKGGIVYQYFDVAPGHFSGMLGAASPGGYLNDNIKPYCRYIRM